MASECRILRLINHSTLILVVAFFSQWKGLTSGQRIENANNKRPLIGDECSVDILFVLDASGSVRDDFKNMRDFVAEVAKTLRVSKTGHRVSLLEYSGPSLTRPRFPFGFVSTTDDFVEFIRRLPFLQGTTATGAALQTALKMLDDRRKDVLTLVIVVTDGYSFDNAEAVATEIRNLENVILFAAGVTEFINREGLVEISGDDGHLWTNPDVIVRAERSLHEYLTCTISAKDLPTKAPASIRSTIASTTTTTTPTQTASTILLTTTTTRATTTIPVTGCEMDAILVIDSSNSVTGVYHSYVDKSVEIIEQLHVAEYFTQIGMVQYSSAGRTVTTFHLNDYHSREDVIRAARQAQFVGGTTNTSAGLEKAAEELDPIHGARPKKALRVVVVFTDGFSQVDPEPVAQKLRRAGVTVYAVSVAESEEEANLEELTSIAGDFSRVYTPKTFSKLVNSLSTLSNRCRR